MIKTLLYLGKANISVTLVKDIMATLRHLHLESSSDFVLTNTGNQLESLVWENHFDQLIRGLQDLCKEQQCTDLDIFVDGHVIKVHTFVLGAYSTVLDELFREDRKIRTLHLPGVSVRSIRSLLTFMYMGKGIISLSDVEDLSGLCDSLNVKSFRKITKNLCPNISRTEKRSENAANVFAKVVPEVKHVLKKLQVLFDQEGKADLTLLVERKRIDTHKSLLGISCPAIHAMLLEEHSNEQSAVLISDADSVSISCLLTLIYNGACFMSQSQMKVATSYLDADLFQIHFNNDSLSTLQDSLNVGKDTQEESQISFAMPRDVDSSHRTSKKRKPVLNNTVLKQLKMPRSKKKKDSSCFSKAKVSVKPKGRKPLILTEVGILISCFSSSVLY